MIRFIDLGNQIRNVNSDEGGREFCFYCTVMDRFLEVFGECTWDSKEDFEQDAKNHNETLKNQNENKIDIDRCISLIPEDFFK